MCNTNGIVKAGLAMIVASRACRAYTTALETVIATPMARARAMDCSPAKTVRKLFNALKTAVIMVGV